MCKSLSNLQHCKPHLKYHSPSIDSNSLASAVVKHCWRPIPNWIVFAGLLLSQSWAVERCWLLLPWWRKTATDKALNHDKRKRSDHLNPLQLTCCPWFQRWFSIKSKRKSSGRASWTSEFLLGLTRQTKRVSSPTLFRFSRDRDVSSPPPPAITIYPFLWLFFLLFFSPQMLGIRLLHNDYPSQACFFKTR